MELKFYLNKFLKVDKIENYTLQTLEELRKVYDKFTDKTEGYDPDFPMMSVGDKQKKGKTIAVGKNNLHRETESGETLGELRDREEFGFSSPNDDDDFGEGFTLRK